MIYLIDRKLVPPTGVFLFRVLLEEEFKNTIHNALQDNTLDCRIVDKEMIGILNEVTKAEIPLCPLSKGKENIEIMTGDSLIMVQVVQNSRIVTHDKPQEHVSLTMNVIKATHYDLAPAGLVTLVKDIQHSSGIDSLAWYTEFRDEITKQIPVEDVRREKPKENPVQIVRSTDSISSK